MYTSSFLHLLPPLMLVPAMGLLSMIPGSDALARDCHRIGMRVPPLS